MRVLKPMLAATVEDAAKLRFPLLASPKLDGIRCLIIDGRPVSRNMKDIPNLHIWHALQDLPNFDGELICGDPKAPDCFNRTSSGVMSREGSPKWSYHVFDMHSMDGSFATRLNRAKLDVKNAVYGKKPSALPLRYVAHKLVTSQEELDDYETQMLIAGFEGVMVRDPAGPYKNGRATLREGWLSKIKRFADGEAEIIGFVEQQHNANELTQDELGRAKRSSAKAGKRGKGTLGALQVRDRDTGVEFEIGTGFDDAQRAEIWGARTGWLGQLVKYKHQPVGQVDKPRFPVYLGLRHPHDA